jgi:uncharacterized RDD family membrane protein YckC
MPPMIYAAPAPPAWMWEDAMTAGTRTRRCLGWLVDLCLIAGLVSAAWSSLLVLGFVTLGLGWSLFTFLPLIPFAYHCLFLISGLCATPGQALFGLVVRRHDDLGPPTLPQAIISTLVFYLTLATSGLLLLVALFTAQKRTLHDLVAGLVVVRRRAWRDWTLTAGAPSWNMSGGSSTA